ncbi:MAG: ABC transporter permease [Acidobacteriota bacterium]
MRRVRGLPLRFRFTWRTDREIRREVDEELRFHLHMRAAELERDGLPAEDAASEALRQFGDYEATRRSLTQRGRRGEQQTRRRRMLDDFWRDTRYAWRSLTRSPGFSAVAVLVLALGIGVNSAMFSLINMLLVRQVMVEEPEELLGVYSQNVERPDDYSAFSYPEYVDLREQNPVFSALAAHDISIVGIADGDVTRRVIAGLVSSNYFDTFGVPIGRGRTFELAEEAPGSNVPVAILSHDYWARRGSDPNILGSTLRVNGELVDVVGVATEGFTGSTAIFSPDLWLPLGMHDRLRTMPGGGPAPATLDDRDNDALMVFGRRKSEIKEEDVETALATLASRFEAAYPAAEGKAQTFTIAPLPRLAMSTSPVNEDSLAAPAVLLTAMTGVVLLIACLNLANMFLARGSSRRSEMAIRLSLGVGRSRLLRQLLTEGLLLALAGGAAGLVLAYWGTKWLMSSVNGLLPIGISLMLDVRPDPWVILATAVSCIVATLFFGLGPAWKLTAGDLLSGLKENTGDRSFGGGKQRSFFAPRNLLIVGQVALSLVLLTAGGLFIRGALAAAETTPGFSLESSLLVELAPSLVGYDEPRSRDVYRQVMERVRSLPQVENAALSSIVPFGSVTSSRNVQLVGPEDPNAAVAAHNYIIGDEYFESLRLSVLRGRGFTATEAASEAGAKVAIIDEPLAAKLFPEADPLGQRVQLAGPVDGEPLVLEIIGLVPGIRHQFWDKTPPPHLYQPFGQVYSSNMHIHVRVASGLPDQTVLLDTIRKEIRAIDPTLPVLGLETMLNHRDESLFLWLVRAGGKLFSVLGLLALFLALVGVYGVKAFVMQRRTREIGIRMALGATRDNVIWQMVREGSALTTAGLVLGFLMALGVAQLLSSMLYEVSASDPLVFLGATLLLAAASTLAAYLPVRRATRIEPTIALRHE